MSEQPHRNTVLRAAANLRPAPEQRAQALRTVRPLQIDPDEAAEIDAANAPVFNIAPDEALPAGAQQALEPRPPRPAPEDPNAPSIFAQAYAEAALTLDDLLPQRIKCAYRIVREIARHRNLLNADESLTELQSEGIDPWVEPMPHNPLCERSEPGWASTKLSRKLLNLLKQADDLPDQHRGTYETENREIKAFRGLAILPPGPPLSAFDPETGQISPYYRPFGDKSLQMYLQIVTVAADHLGIARGTAKEPDLGRKGLAGLLEPHLVRLAWPSRLQIMAWESILVEETLQLQVEYGTQRARRKLTHRYGFLNHELTSLLKQSNRIARQVTENEVEDDRALMIMRMEDAARRAKKSLDLRAELAALKNLSIILGINQAEANDPMSDIVNTIRSVSRERQK